MDYLLYILAILVIGLVCLVTIRIHFRQQDAARPAGNRSSSNRKSSNHPEGPDPKNLNPADFKPAIQRALLHIRTPWGWPRHLEHNRIEPPPPKYSRGMRAFTDRLVGNEKAGRGNSRSEASMRALLEDRYGRNPPAMTEMEYRKVKPPRLRDPSEPHDQMDNFGTREAERVRQKLKLLSSMNAESGVPEELKDLRYVDLKDIKRPWGW